MSKFSAITGTGPLDRKAAIAQLNAARNSLKHFCETHGMSFDYEDEAYEMIERAASNYWLLRQEETPQMARFGLHSKERASNQRLERP